MDEEFYSLVNLMPLLQEVEKELGHDCPKEIKELVLTIKILEKKHEKAPLGFVDHLNILNEEDGIAKFDTLANTTRRCILSADDFHTSVLNSLRMFKLGANRYSNDTKLAALSTSNQLNCYAGLYFINRTGVNSVKAYISYKKSINPYVENNPEYYQDQILLNYLNYKKHFIYTVPKTFLDPNPNNNFIANYEDTLNLSGLNLYRQVNGSVSTYGNSSEALYRIRSVAMCLVAGIVTWLEKRKNKNIYSKDITGTMHKLMVALSTYYLAAHAISFSNAAAQYFRMEEGPAKDKYFDLMLETYIKDLPPELYAQGKNDYWYHVDRILTVGGVQGPQAKHDRVRRLAWALWAFAKNHSDLAIANASATHLSFEGLKSGAFFTKYLAVLAKINFYIQASAHAYAISMKVNQGYKEGKYKTERAFLEAYVPPMLSQLHAPMSTLTTNIFHTKQTIKQLIKTNPSNVTPAYVNGAVQRIFNEFGDNFFDYYQKASKNRSDSLIKNFHQKLVRAFQTKDTSSKTLNALNDAAIQIKKTIQSRLKKNYPKRTFRSHLKIPSPNYVYKPKVVYNPKPPKVNMLFRAYRSMSKSDFVKWVRQSYSRNKDTLKASSVAAGSRVVYTIADANKLFTQMPRYNNPVYLEHYQKSSRFLTLLSQSHYMTFRFFGREFARQGAFLIYQVGNIQRFIGNSIRHYDTYHFGNMGRMTLQNIHGVGILPAFYLTATNGAKVVCSTVAQFTPHVLVFAVSAGSTYLICSHFELYDDIAESIANTGEMVKNTLYSPVYIYNGSVDAYDRYVEDKYAPSTYRKIVQYKDPFTNELIYIGSFQAKTNEKLLKKDFDTYLAKRKYATYSSDELNVVVDMQDSFNFSSIPIEPSYYAIKDLNGKPHFYIPYQRAKEIFITDAEMKKIMQVSEKFSDELKQFIIRKRIAKKVKETKFDIYDMDRFLVDRKKFAALKNNKYVYNGKVIDEKTFKKHLTTDDIIPGDIINSNSGGKIKKDPFSGEWSIVSENSCIVYDKEDHLWKSFSFNMKNNTYKKPTLKEVYSPTKTDKQTYPQLVVSHLQIGLE